MDLGEVKARVGLEKYAAACAVARSNAPTHGMKPATADERAALSAEFPADKEDLSWDELMSLADKLVNPLKTGVPMDIGEMIWEAALPDEDKVRLLFQVYADMPTSSLFFYLTMNYEALSGATRVFWWDNVRLLLSQPDLLRARPLMYCLWCDFFEDTNRVAEAWNALVTVEADPVLLEHVLEVSGPVPFAWKEQLYARLIPDKRWHPAIFSSLLFGQFDTFGKIDRTAARDIFQQLDLPENTQDLSLLQQALLTN